MNKLLFVALFLFAPITLASADLKIAVIDLSKTFDAYYKTKEMSTHIEDQKVTYTKEVQALVSEYQQMQKDAKDLYDQANNPALAKTAKDDANKALQAKQQDLMNMQSRIQETQTERRNEIQDEVLRRRKDILDDITKVINEYSGPQGYDLVVDKSAASIANGVAPIVLYNSSKLTDITDDIIAKLNASAPAATTTTTPPAPH